MSETYGNAPNPAPTLSAGINSSVTSLTLTSGGGAGLPSTGTFRVLIDLELILVGARSGDTLSSLTRGAESTTAASHSSGVNVNIVFTAGGLLAGRANQNQIGLYSSLPTSPDQGDTYRCTDIPFSLLYDGTKWRASYKNFLVNMPAFSSWGTANLTPGTAIQLPGDAVYLTSSVGVINLLTQSGLPSPPYTVTIFAVMDLNTGGTTPSFQNAHMVPVVLNSGNGKLVDTQLNLSQVAAGTEWTLPSTFVGNSFFSVTPEIGWDILGQRIVDDGTHRTYFFSTNLGISWTPMFQESSANYVTPDQWGIAVIANPSYTLGMLVLSAVQT